MIKLVDGYLNHVTMYRLVLYYAASLLAADFALGILGLSPHDPAQMVFSVVIIAAVCWFFNRGLAQAFRVPANTESFLITALLIALIMPPAAPKDWPGIAGLVLASAVAMGTKYVLAIHRKHIFNPAAAGVLFSALAVDQPATWWIGGSIYLLPLVCLGGLLILRKLQRFEMFAAYVVANFAVAAVATPAAAYGEALGQIFLSSPLLFCGFAMLTEPMTAPAAKFPALAFGAVVGGLLAPSIHLGDFYFTPELALLAGNALAWLVNPKFRYKLTLERIEKTAAGCYDYVFRANPPVLFKPGQYLDWTLPSRHADDRGNRRTFTIASAPAERQVRMGVKFYPQPSAYKQALLALKPGDVVYGAQLAGDFTLPDTPDKLAFIAGGIGITPFRSMIQHMMDRGERREVTLFYGNNRAQDIAYVDVFNRAENELGLRTVYAVADLAHATTNLHKGFIDADLIMREMPDYAERRFYISGPRAMVVRFQKVLAELGIAKSRIKTDFFPGFA